MNSTAGAALLQRAHDAEQPLDLVPGERGGRLVHDQHARVERERLGDLHELLVGDREPADGLLGIELDAEAVHQLLHRAVQLAAVDAAHRPERVAAHHHVLRHRQVGEERRLLVDHRDARVAGIRGAVERDRLTVDQHVALVGPLYAGEHPHDRRLAGAVLTRERPDLSGAQRDRDVPRGAHRAVGLAGALEGDDRCSRLSCRLLVDLRLLPLETTEHDQNRAIVVCQERMAILCDRFVFDYGRTLDKPITQWLSDGAEEIPIARRRSDEDTGVLAETRRREIADRLRRPAP